MTSQITNQKSEIPPDPNARPLLHLADARHFVGQADYCLKAAIREWHREGPHAVAAALILQDLNLSFDGLFRLIQKVEKEIANRKSEITNETL